MHAYLLSSLAITLIAGTTNLNGQDQNAALYLEPGAVLTVQNGTAQKPALTIKGDIVLLGVGAQIDNQGYMRFTGNIQNDQGGVFTSTGHEEFTGTTDQMLLGAFSGTSYFGKVKRSQTAGANLVCANNVDMWSLDLGTNPGVVDLGTYGTVLRIKNAHAGAIANATPLTYVYVGTENGFLARMMGGNAADNSFLFPIGDKNGYRGIGLTLDPTEDAGNVTATLKNLPGTLNVVHTDNVHGQVQFNWLWDTYWSFTGPSTHHYTVDAYVSAMDADVNRIVQGTPATWESNFPNTVGALNHDVHDYSTWSGTETVSIKGGKYQGYQDLALASGHVTSSLFSLADRSSESDAPKTLLVDCYPNPSKGAFVITVNSSADIEATIQIFNALGQQVHQEPAHVQKGGFMKTLYIDVADGEYQVRVMSANGTSTTPLVIRR